MRLKKKVRLTATFAALILMIALGFSLGFKVTEVKASKIIPCHEEQETVKPWLFYSNAHQSQKQYTYQSRWCKFEKPGISLISNFSITCPSFKLKAPSTGPFNFTNGATILNAWRYKFFAQTHIFRCGRVFATLTT
jgi:hypothetical protein